VKSFIILAPGRFMPCLKILDWDGSEKHGTELIRPVKTSVIQAPGVAFLTLYFLHNL
jgi:hypothetical protein